MTPTRVDTRATTPRSWVIQMTDIPRSCCSRRTSSTTARRFFFTSEDQSYGAWLGKTRNLGIISAAVFREKLPEPQPLYQPGEREERRADARRAAGTLGVADQRFQAGRRHTQGPRSEDALDRPRFHAVVEHGRGPVEVQIVDTLRVELCIGQRELQLVIEQREQVAEVFELSADS